MEKKVLKYFFDNGIHHLVVRRKKPSVCTNCGFTFEDDTFFSVNGSIIEITDETTIVRLLNGNLRTLGNDDILRIEVYDLEIARRNQSGGF